MEGAVAVTLQSKISVLVATDAKSIAQVCTFKTFESGTHPSPRVVGLICIHE